MPAGKPPRDPKPPAPVPFDGRDPDEAPYTFEMALDDLIEGDRRRPGETPEEFEARRRAGWRAELPPELLAVFDDPDRRRELFGEDDVESDAGLACDDAAAIRDALTAPCLTHADLVRLLHKYVGRRNLSRAERYDPGADAVDAFDAFALVLSEPGWDAALRRDPDDFANWLRGAIAAAIRRRRSRLVAVEHERAEKTAAERTRAPYRPDPDAVAPPKNTPEAIVADVEAERNADATLRLLMAAANLTAKEAAVFDARAWRELDGEATARELGIERNAVDQLLARAKAKFRALPEAWLRGALSRP
jgi:RNA polymerase sigma factor (sigma-70 family)